MKPSPLGASFAGSDEAATRRADPWPPEGSVRARRYRHTVSRPGSPRAGDRDSVPAGGPAAYASEKYGERSRADLPRVGSGPRDPSKACTIRDSESDQCSTFSDPATWSAADTGQCLWWLTPPDLNHGNWPDADDVSRGWGADASTAKRVPGRRRAETMTPTDDLTRANGNFHLSPTFSLPSLPARFRKMDDRDTS
jgi:hypothetical protein